MVRGTGGMFEACDWVGWGGGRGGEQASKHACTDALNWRCVSVNHVNIYTKVLLETNTNRRLSEHPTPHPEGDNPKCQARRVHVTLGILP